MPRCPSIWALPCFHGYVPPGYINSWLQILKNDTKAIFTTAADFILTRVGLSVADEELPAAA